MKKTALGFFIFVSVIELTSGFLENEFVHMAAKPLIMIFLGLYYFLSAGNDRSTTVICAIILSLAGDIFLLNADYFIPGLAAFLVAHLLYIFSYRQHRYEDVGDEGLKGIQRIRLAFPVILAGTGLVIILYPVLGALKIPVMVYALIITLMVLNALFRFGRTNKISFWFVFLGAVLFMFSDSVLAINKFLTPVANSNYWIMLSYVAAQFFIIEGLLRHHSSEPVEHKTVEL